jgi:hypothetical protein
MAIRISSRWQWSNEPAESVLARKRPECRSRMVKRHGGQERCLTYRNLPLSVSLVPLNLYHGPKFLGFLVAGLDL